MSPSDDVIELEDFLAYVDAHLTDRSDENVEALAPKLIALSRNRTFLSRFLTESLPSREFQRDNGFNGPVFILARGDGYVVRAVAWTTEDRVERTPRGAGPHLYHGPQQVAHSHSCSLLTVGYFGPGYETDVWECEPETIRAAGDAPGTPVSTRYRGRFRLSEGAVLFYRAYRDLHVQHPPQSYSISLNLLVQPPAGHAGRDQYFVDLTDNTLAAAMSTANNARSQLIGLAQAFPDPRLLSPLGLIAERHMSSRIRARAAAALQRVEAALAQPTAPGARS